jgi:hypothetical protein
MRISQLVRGFTVFAIASGMVIGTQSLGHAQSASQDLHQAGHDTKNAAKDTGHGISEGTKKVYHKTASGTKKVAKKTKSTTVKGYDKTKSGTVKTYDKTKEGTDNLVHGKK